MIRLSSLPAAGGLARAGRPRQAQPPSATRTTGAGRCRASAIPRPACWSAAWPPRPTAATAPAASSPATAPATACSPRCTAPASPTSPPRTHRDDGLRADATATSPPASAAPAGQQADARERDACLPYLVPGAGAAAARARASSAWARFAWDGVLRVLARRWRACRPPAALRPRRRGDRRGRTRCSAATTPASRTPSPAG